MTTSTAYQAASETHRVAIRAYNAAVTKYRALEIDDDEFNVAQVAKAEADKAFDVAFELEANRPEETIVEDDDNSQMELI